MANKYYVITTSYNNYNDMYGILEKEEYKIFKEERDMTQYRAFKVTESELHNFLKIQGKQFDEYKGYVFDAENENLIIFPGEELYYFEALDQYYSELRAVVTEQLKIILEGSVHYTPQEELVLRATIQDIYDFALSEESEYMYDEFYSIINDAKFMKHILKGFGYIGT